MINNVKQIKKIKIGQKKVVIILSDLSKLEISPETYTEFNLFVGKNLTKKDIEQIESRNNIDKLYSYALKLLSNKSYSINALKEKLAKKSDEQKQIDEVINLLIKYSLIDESSLIKEYLEYADYKHFGYNRIKEDLIKKGIPLYKIESIKYDEVREYRLSKELIPSLEKKYSKYNHFLKKKHCYDSLLRLGYNYDVAKSVVEQNITVIDKKHEMSLLKIDYKKAKEKYSKKYQGHELNEKINSYLVSRGYQYKDIKEIN